VNMICALVAASMGHGKRPAQLFDLPAAPF